MTRGVATWLAFLLYGLFAYLLNGLGAATERLRSDLGVSRGVVGLHATAFAAGLVAGGFVGDRLSRRLGRGAAAVVAATGMAGGVVLLIAGRGPAATIAGALVMGTSGSLLLVVAPAFLADRYGESAAAALALANAVASLCAALAPFLVGAAVASGLGWRAAFVAGAAVLLAVATAFWRAIREPSHAAAQPAVPGERRLPGSYWWWWATLVLVVSVEFSFVFWIAEELRVATGAPPALAAGSVAVFVLAMAAGRLATGRLLHRAEGLTLLRAGLLLSVAGFAVFWVAPVLAPALAGLALAGLGVAVLYPLSLAAAIATGDGRSDLASGRAALASGVAIGAAPFALGWLADARGVHAAYLVVPLLAAAALVSSAIATGRSDTVAAARPVDR
ncbi:MAG TPA: MFS transporter [Candidatus Dormibacteraeota bacterium]|nr:MFS transporter [Candidatus Dormibacteraeota bacterium]